MSSAESASPRHGLGWFFVLTLAFSWWGNLIADHSMFPLGPFLAALVVLAITGGRSGVMGFIRRIGQWRIGPRWYALGLFVGSAFAFRRHGAFLTAAHRVDSREERDVLISAPCMAGGEPQHVGSITCHSEVADGLSCVPW